MSDELTVKKPEHRLKVGSNENYISFEITATQATSKLKADISIPCGQLTSDKTYLCADGVRANLIPQSEPAGKLKFLKQPAKAALVSWRSSDFSLNAGEKVKIKITGFNPERDGSADLQLKIGNPKSLYNESHAVSIAPAVGAAIIDFDVSSTSVLQRSKVTITGITTGAKTVKLYADEAEVKALSSNTQTGVTVSTYTHAPEADTTYRLEAADALAGKFAERKIVVSVTSRQTWSSRDLLANSLEYDSAGLIFMRPCYSTAKT